MPRRISYRQGKGRGRSRTIPPLGPQPGKRPTAVYLGGPYKGGPFSIVAVVPAEAGPFDFGDEVVRSALYVNPKTAQGSVKSDPLPQIIEGIPIRYRTIQVELDRPNFTLNPTSCGTKQIESAITSSQGALAHPSSHFQVANCANLGFKPNLSVELQGGVKRGAHPALHAVVRPRQGDANLATTVVRLPHSAFLDQAHIRTICTRVQYAAKACPEGAVYGHIKAVSPLLDKPLEGPIYLRSSDHNLPDLVFALHGEVDVEAVGRIDSVGGGIRAGGIDAARGRPWALGLPLMARMQMLSVLFAACLLALGVSSCGDGGDSTSTTSPATQDQASGTTGSSPGAKPAGEKTTGKSGAQQGKGSAETEAPVAKPHHDSGGGVAQFQVKGGDNSVQEFGAEAGGSELDEAAAALHGFLDARAAGDWAKACSYVAASVTGSLQKLAGNSKQLQGKGCGAILEALSGGVPRSTLEEAAEADVGAMRVEGGRSFLLYHGARNTDYTMPMAKEGNAWKVASLAGTPLS